MSNNDWYLCSTMADVAKAQEAGHEIEASPTPKNNFGTWSGEVWNKYFYYRARAQQPAMKEIKMECWLNNGALHWFIEGSWKHGSRQPHLDMIAKVPE